MSRYRKNLSLRESPSLRQLRAFSAIYHTGQISAAADQLGLTQPAVTVLLRDLESKLGVKLFDRTARGLRRTEAAQEAIGYAERIFTELQAFTTCMGEFADAKRGRVRVACTATIVQTLLPLIMRRFADKHPEITLELHEVAPSDFVETVLSQRVDCGIATLEKPVSGLKEHIILRDTLCAVALPSHLPTPSDTITWAQLATLPVITMKAGYGVRTQIDSAARQVSESLCIVQEVSLIASALALAEAGVGVALVPGALANRHKHPDLIARQIIKPSIGRDIALVHPAERVLSPAAGAFYEACAATLKTLPAAELLPGAQQPFSP